MKLRIAIIVLVLAMVACKVTELPDKTMVELCESMVLPVVLVIIALVVRL